MEQQKKQTDKQYKSRSRSTIRRRKIKTRQLPSRRAKEAMEVTPSVESMVDTVERTAD